MMWAKFDDQFYLNPKNAAMDRDEQDLYIASLIYSNGQLTDGFIPARVLAMLAVWAKLPDEANAQAIASHLVEHGFWEISPKGWQIHDFLDWNMSKAEALELKATRSEAGRRGGLKSVAKRQANAKANAQAKLNPDPDPEPKELINSTPLDEFLSQADAWIGCSMTGQDDITSIEVMVEQYGLERVKLAATWIKEKGTSRTMRAALKAMNTTLSNGGFKEENTNGRKPQKKISAGMARLLEGV